jgi:ferredoxin-NADP reductase
MTPQSVAISFAIPEEFQDEFAYIPGQYITLKAEVDGQKANRAYSLCSSPFTGEALTIGVKQNRTWTCIHLSEYKAHNWRFPTNHEADGEFYIEGEF